MNFIKIILKTYLVSCILSYIYLFLIHLYFADGEVIYVMMAIFFGNALLSVLYTLAILLPFNFLFKHIIEANNLNIVLHKYLIYFSLIPMFLIGMGIFFIVQDGNNGVQFTLLIFDLCCIIYTGLVQLLKYKTLS